MRKFIFYQMIISFFCLLFVLACDNDDADKVPVIVGVRSIDASKADSLFTDGVPGQMIVLVGENLHGVKNIFINNQKISFNPAYVTSSHIILFIPGELTLVGDDSSLPAEIRVETDHGIAAYPFHVNSPAPYAISYTTEWDGDNPIQPGQLVTVAGKNFYEIKRVLLTNINPYATDEEGKPILPEEPLIEYEIPTYAVDEKFEIITLAMPEYVFERGFLVIECYSGNAVLGFRSHRPKKPEILSISSDMPIVGEICTISGKNFKDPISIVIGKDEVAIPATNLNVDDSGEKLDFVLPTMPKIGERLVLITEEGRDTIPFYKTSYVVADFDNFGGWAWGGYPEIGANAVNNTTASNAPKHTSGIFWGIEGKTQPTGWWGPMSFNNMRAIESIPEDTPMEQIELRFECYYSYSVEEGSVCEIKYPDAAKSCQLSAFVDHLSGVTQIGKWMTCSFPLTAFSDVATYGEFLPILLTNKTMFIHICNTKVEQNVGLYVDNFRLYVNNN